MKKNLKKAISAVIALALSLSLIPASFAAKLALTDVADTASYATAVNTLVALDIINGYEDNTFKPDDLITRAEVTKVVVAALNKSSDAESLTGATGFVDRVGNFFNTKVINPIKEKIIDNEEDFEDVEVVSPEERREGLHVIDRRRTVPVDAEYSEIDEEEDFYEEDEEEPGWVQKLLDRFLNPEDDLEEDVYYDEEEDDPGIVDTVREFFHNRKAERAANRTEEVREETKPKSKLADKIRGFFYDEEEVFDEEQVEVVETYPEDEEDYSRYTVPDPEIYEAIIRERNEKTEE